MYREISQDILYVRLNISLALAATSGCFAASRSRLGCEAGKSILENSNLNINNKVNLSVLEKMISDHYNTYDKGYKLR